MHAAQTENNLNPAAYSIGSKATTAENDARPQNRYKSRGSDCQTIERADMQTSKLTSHSIQFVDVVTHTSACDTFLTCFF